MPPATSFPLKHLNCPKVSQYSKFPSFYIPASDCTSIIISCQPCSSSQARPGQQGNYKNYSSDLTTRYWTTQQIVQTVRLNYLISEFLNFDIDPQNILKGIYFHIITQSSLNKLSPSDIGMRVCDDRQFANETISY